MDHGLLLQLLTTCTQIHLHFMQVYIWLPTMSSISYNPEFPLKLPKSGFKTGQKTLVKKTESGQC